MASPRPAYPGAEELTGRTDLLAQTPGINGEGSFDVPITKIYLWTSGD